MKIGTKSVLVGVHAFWLHPFVIALGWWKEYRFRRIRIGTRMVPRHVHVDGGGFYRFPEQRDVYTWLLDPRLWVAFIVHDIGYLGKPNLDGPEGETHPEVGAAIMRRLFGEPWGEFVLTHSRYYAKKLGKDVSPLCFADKWAIILEPSWLYLPRVWVTGELAEFMANARKRAHTQTAADPLSGEERAGLAVTAREWHRATKVYMRRWIAYHRDGRPDQWTRLRHEPGRGA